MPHLLGQVCLLRVDLLKGDALVCLGHGVLHPSRVHRSPGRDVRRAAALGKGPVVNHWDPRFIETVSSHSTGAYGLLRSSFSRELVIRGRRLSPVRKLTLLQSAQHRALGLDGIRV